MSSTTSRLRGGGAGQRRAGQRRGRRRGRPRAGATHAAGRAPGRRWCVPSRRSGSDRRCRSSGRSAARRQARRRRRPGAAPRRSASGPCPRHATCAPAAWPSSSFSVSTMSASATRLGSPRMTATSCVAPAWLRPSQTVPTAVPPTCTGTCQSTVASPTVGIVRTRRAGHRAERLAEIAGERVEQGPWCQPCTTSGSRGDWPLAAAGARRRGRAPASDSRRT